MPPATALPALALEGFGMGWDWELSSPHPAGPGGCWGHEDTQQVPVVSHRPLLPGGSPPQAERSERYRQTDGQTDRRADGQAGGRTGGRTDRQQREPQVRAERGGDTAERDPEGCACPGSPQPSSCRPDPAAGAGRAPSRCRCPSEHLAHQDRRPSAFLAEQARAELVGQSDPPSPAASFLPSPGLSLAFDSC